MHNNLSFKIGLSLIFLALISVVIYFFPIIKLEIAYNFNKPDAKAVPILSGASVDHANSESTIQFKNNDFGLVIPKIGVNSNVVENVDPFNEAEYQEKLKLGVAHAKGTSFPAEDGNVFLFAHSAVNFYEASKYNIQFNLLNKMEVDDDIYIAYKSEIYHYKVESVKTVDPSQIEYLTNYYDHKTVTLMSCWPAGLDYKRVIVIAKEI